MPPKKFNSINELEKNLSDVYLDTTEVLLRIAKNILDDPSNQKYRSISLGSKVVTNKLLPAFGAMECLFEMGFQEGEDKLILPQSASLNSLKIIYDELVKKREQRQIPNKSISFDESLKKPDENDENEKVSLVVKDLTALASEIKNSFLKKCLFWCFYVLKYENYDLQLKALKLVPLTEINLNVMKNIRKIQQEFKKKQINEEIVDYQELLLFEICNWFNREFFSWVDTPQCTKCGFIETFHIGLSSKKFKGADRVEVYKCIKCNERVLFPRYNEPEILLQTRKGRCGEWANCFCLFARALGWDARLVFDETDHVWIEVYSVTTSRWIHCDPCENIIDSPLMYECGWKKKLSYVIAYSKDEIQDVTWRYSCKHAQVLKNRKKCSEKDLIDFINKVRSIMLSQASPARRSYVIKRAVLELVELMKQKPVSEAERKGRISGSLSWRLLRGETTIQSEDEIDFKPYVWKVDKEDELKKKFVLSYITSKDEYLKHSKFERKKWASGLYSVKSVFKKVENDWKMTYLGITENADHGTVSWKFDTGEKFSIGTIDLKLVRKTFETGKLICKLCSDDACILVPNVAGKESFLTDAFKGSKTVELTVELFGGSGSNAWQHAQILRQSLYSEETTFNITINLI